MEETFMKFAKSAGGLTGLYLMFWAYQRSCQKTSTGAQFFEGLLDICGLVDDPDCPKAGEHRELERAEVKKSEEAVQNTITAITSFSNPFARPDKDHLYSLASRAQASTEVEKDVLGAAKIGRNAKAVFITERFVSCSSEESLFEPIQRLKLKTMESTNKTVKLTASQGKIVQYQEQSNIAFTLLVKSQQLREPIQLEEVMKYPLTPVPHSLGTPDGFFMKTNQAAIIPMLLEDIAPDETYQTDALYIQDGNALFHSLTNLGPTFGAIGFQILDQMVAKRHFVFSTDSYNAMSNKAQERLRRGVSQKYIVDGPATRKPTDFKLFLTNDENKVQLCKLLLKLWGKNEAAFRLQKCLLAVLVVNGQAYRLSSANGEVNCDEIPELSSNKEETDTRVAIYLKYAATQGYNATVSLDVVRHKMLKKMSGDEEQLSTKTNVDLSKLPPCKSNVLPHIQRVAPEKETNQQNRHEQQEMSELNLQSKNFQNDSSKYEATPNGDCVNNTNIPMADTRTIQQNTMYFDREKSRWVRQQRSEQGKSQQTNIQDADEHYPEENTNKIETIITSKRQSTTNVNTNPHESSIFKFKGKYHGRTRSYFISNMDPDSSEHGLNQYLTDRTLTPVESYVFHVDGGCRDVNGTSIANQTTIDRKTFGTMGTNKPIMEYGIVMFPGDMNADIVVGNNQSNFRNEVFTNFLRTNDLLTLVHFPLCKGPRYTYTTMESMLDHIIISNRDKNLIECVNILDDVMFNVSDHLPVFAIVKVPVIRIINENVNRHIAWQKNKSDTHIRISSKTRNTIHVDEMYEAIEAIILSSNQCLPQSKFNRHAKPYWTPEVKKSYSLQREARRVWVLEGEPRGWHNESYAKYKRCKQIFQLIEAAECDSRLFWSLIKSRKNKRPSACTHLFYKNISVREPGDILKAFTNYFRDVYSPLQCEHFDNDFKKLVEEKVKQLKIKKTVPQIAFQK
ncbi:hypothetical protein MAR_009461 [Mya arenaria]|uniref:Uncharacterized protein n=1 Tax=Mya arenaria TaxID=6604 RepID=A0ABY7E255_MYAAR|nr:hypothetical protein MAR_009461 [Mya arenaria]